MDFNLKELSEDQKYRLWNADRSIQENFGEKKDYYDLGYTDSEISEGFEVVMNPETLIRQFNLKTGGEENNAFWKSYVDSSGFKRIIDNQKKWTKEQNWDRDRVKLVSRNNKEFYNGFKRNIENMDADFIYAGRPSANSFATSEKDKSDWRKSYYVIGTEDSYNEEGNIFFPAVGTESHEYYHLADPHIGNEDLDTTQNRILDLNQNTSLTNNRYSNEHDAKNIEKAADLAALKKLLYLEGIYDVRGEEDATPEHIQKLREKYPNLRPLLQMDNEKTSFMINHIVQNNNQNNNPFYNDYYTT